MKDWDFTDWLVNILLIISCILLLFVFALTIDVALAPSEVVGVYNGIITDKECQSHPKPIYVGGRCSGYIIDHTYSFEIDDQDNIEVEKEVYDKFNESDQITYTKYHKTSRIFHYEKEFIEIEDVK